jgi:hypothetical protein
MADEIEGEEQLEESSDDLFNRLSNEEPEDEIEVPNAPHAKTLEEQEAENTHLSDLQSVIKMRFPDWGNHYDNAIQMSRISPDVFKPYLRLCINGEIRKQNPYKPVDVTNIAKKYYAALTIGLDGKGGIDLIELAGVANDKEIAELSKNLGLGGS